MKHRTKSVLGVLTFGSLIFLTSTGTEVWAQREGRIVRSASLRQGGTATPAFRSAGTYRPGRSASGYGSMREWHQQGYPDKFGQGQCRQPANPPGLDGQCGGPLIVGQHGDTEMIQCPQSDPAPVIQEGVCYSQCILEGRSRTEYEKVEICTPCKMPSVDFINETEEIEVEISGETYELIVPASDCTETQVLVHPAYSMWELVRDAIWEIQTIQSECPHGTIPIPPTYTKKPVKIPNPKSPVNKPIPVITPLHNGTVEVKIRSKYNKLSRTSTRCTAAEKELGLYDCSQLCNEPSGPDMTMIPTQSCQDTECRFRPKPQKLPPLHYTRLVPTDPVPWTPQVCPPERIKVMVEPPVFEEREVPAEYKTVESCTTPEVTKQVIPPVFDVRTYGYPIYTTSCEAQEPVYDCIERKIQVCEPVLVWRQEAFCSSTGGDAAGSSGQRIQIIIQVQTILIQFGYDARPINGRMHSKAQQAISNFQRDRGLAVGGTLTVETLNALGIYE